MLWKLPLTINKLEVNMRKLSILSILFMAAVHLSFAAPKVDKPLPLKAPQPPISYTINDFIDVNFSVGFDCVGELIELQGQLHLLLHVTQNDNNIITKTHAQLQGVTGVGTSGTQYQVIGHSESHSKGSMVNGQYVFTAVYYFKVIGQGPADNLLMRTMYHMTLNANGELTADIDTISTVCK